jgi:hypothetical protein
MSGLEGRYFISKKVTWIFFLTFTSNVHRTLAGANSHIRCILLVLHFLSLFNEKLLTLLLLGVQMRCLKGTVGSKILNFEDFDLY